MLALPILNPFGAGNSAPAVRPTGPTSTSLPGQPTRTPYTPEVSGQPKCGGPLIMTLLAIGSDSRGTGYLYGLADVIRYVRVDFATPRITVLEFPRDIWVEIPELDPKHGIDHGKLNQAYLYGNRGMGYYHGPGEGPGLLARTLQELKGRRRMAVIVGDLATDNDAQRLQVGGATAVQIQTGTFCHLEAAMVSRALDALELTELDLLFIENVGNLVCPAAYDLGENSRVVLFSTTEGEDKPLKYPRMFKSADLVLITKSDLTEVLGFDRALALENLRQVAPHAPVLEVSARSGEGLEGWYRYLQQPTG